MTDPADPTDTAPVSAGFCLTPDEIGRVLEWFDDARGHRREWGEDHDPEDEDLAARLKGRA